MDYIRSFKNALFGGENNEDPNNDDNNNNDEKKEETQEVDSEVLRKRRLEALMNKSNSPKNSEPNLTVNNNKESPVTTPLKAEVNKNINNNNNNNIVIKEIKEDKKERGKSSPLNTPGTSPKPSNNSINNNNNNNNEDNNQGRSSPSRGSQLSSSSSSGSSPSNSLSSSSLLLSSSPKSSQIHPALNSAESLYIKRIFNITLEPEKATDKALFLPNLSSDLNNNPQPLSLVDLDRLIVERLMLESEVNLNIPYLLSCFITSQQELNKSKMKEKEKFFKEVQQYIVRYFVICLQNPLLFSPISISPYKLFYSALESNKVPSPFISSILSLYLSPDDQHPDEKKMEEVKEIFMPLLDEIRNHVMSLTLLDDFLSPISTLSFLITNYKPLADVLIRSPNWVLSKEMLETVQNVGRRVEKETYLGPFFQFTTFPHHCPIVSQTLLDPAHNNPKALQIAFTSLREKLYTLHTSLYDLLMAIIKNNPVEGKEAVITYISHILIANNSLTKLRIDRNLVAEDGFFLNFSAVLLKFCEPFLSPFSDKLGLIEGYYLQSGYRIPNCKDDTKLAASSSELERWVDQRNMDNIERWKRMNPSLSLSPSDIPKLERVGFTTECFFLTYRSLHLGYLKSLDQYQKLLQYRADLMNQLKVLEESANPALLPNIDALKLNIEGVTKRQNSVNAMMLDSKFIISATHFYITAAKWFIQKIDGEGKGMPLPSTPPMQIATLPEHILEDIADFFTLSMSIYPINSSIIKSPHSSNFDILYHLITLLIGSPSYVKNPYLRGKLMKILSSFIYYKTNHPDHFQLTLHTHPIVSRDLVHSLMVFYVDIEFTGGHTQFYDKFNLRSEVQLIFQYLWKIPIFDEAFLRESENSKLFLKFINMILNDAIYLLDGGLLHLAKIRSIQLSMSDPSWSSLSPEEQEDKRKELESFEKQAKGEISLSTNTLQLLHYLTGRTVKPFLLDELIDRIASMLNFFLAQLASDKCRSLKVQNMEKYHFDPKKLLGFLIDIYINLSSQSFAEAVSKDGRSYDPDIFTYAADVIDRTSLRSPAVRKAILDFRDLTKKIKDDHAMKIADLDIPDEFLDPLTAEIMTDPVRLPSTGISIDRKVISRHLLSDATDPFNRSPLTLEDLIPDDVLKAKISDFLRKHGL